jgi:hypothetical protein
MSKTFKIPFAYTLEGKVVDIETAQKGEIYLCSCGAEVKLRGGEIVRDHFYHINESECSLESAIHKAYKTVFQTLKRIQLPHAVNGVKELCFDRVELEKKVDDYVPDAIGYIGNEPHLIEFAKTSYIGERKENKIKKSNLFCLEVSIVKTITTIAEIEKHLTSDSWYKHIIHVPEYAEMRELREKFKDAYNKLKYENERMQRVNNKLSWENGQLKGNTFGGMLEGGDLALFYQKDCKNGAKFYKRDIDKGAIIGFENKGVFTIKFDSMNNRF